MAKLVILITARGEEGHNIGEAWQKAGAPGVTLIDCYGLRRLQEASKSYEVLPGMLSMLQLLREREETSLIVLSAVEDEALVDRLIDATQAIIGDLREPNNGLAFVINVERAVGLLHKNKD
jgi:nitrogen regulatory protein PII